MPRVENDDVLKADARSSGDVKRRVYDAMAGKARPAHPKYSPGSSVGGVGGFNQVRGDTGGDKRLHRPRDINSSARRSALRSASASAGPEKHCSVIRLRSGPLQPIGLE